MADRELLDRLVALTDAFGEAACRDLSRVVDLNEACFAIGMLTAALHRLGEIDRLEFAAELRRVSTNEIVPGIANGIEEGNREAALQAANTSAARH